MTPTELAKRIDHTLLRPDATAGEIERLCAEAKSFGFASVCVNPIWVGTAARLLAGSGVEICSVVGFPLGATPTRVKVGETLAAIDDGATELDMVLDLGSARDGDWSVVRGDIAAVVEAGAGRVVKVIIECAVLTEDEKREATRQVVAAGAAFVKTSTGFASGGATVEDVRLLAATAAGRCRVKAAGGIRTLEQAEAMLAAGADRIGASAGVAIVRAMTAR